MNALVIALLTLTTMAAQRGPDAPLPAADAAFYAVWYVEVPPSAGNQALTAIRQYRDAIRPQEGHVRLELFEQAGRPGHFAFLETWKNQSAADARAAARQKLVDALQPIRISGLDERPYKTLTVVPPAASPNARTVAVITHVDVTPDPRVADLLKRLAEASRREPGNLRFDVMQHTMRANHFTVVEFWRDQQALDAHVAAAHTKQYREELQPTTGSPLDERVFRRIE